MYDKVRQSTIGKSEPGAGNWQSEIRPSTGSGRPEALEGRNLPAFTMVELMIAIAIMGVGMAMAAAIFPTAIKENQTSFNNTLGDLICENGLAVAKAISPSPGLTLAPISIGEADSCYPRPYTPKPGPPIDDSDWKDDGFGNVDPKTLTGFIVLGREINPRDYMLVVIAYKKTDITYTVEAIFTSNVEIADVWDAKIADWRKDVSELKIENILPPGNLQYFTFGVWVITSEGRFARITEFNPINNNPLISPRQTVGSNVTVWTIAQIDPGGTVGENPVMSVFVTRTGLQN